MKRSGFVALGTAIVLSMLGAEGVVEADRDKDRDRTLRTRLSGLEEPPAVLTAASGDFTAVISQDLSGFEYTLRFEDLSGNVTQSHIHIGQVLVNGGIAIWLCQTATNPAPAAVSAATPDCGGPNSSTVTGVVTPAQVIGPNGQGIAPMDFERVLTAMRKGLAYVNVHSSRSPGGEIRGQLKLDEPRGRGNHK